MTFASIKAILDARQFDALIGQHEDSSFDAKGRHPYDFTTPTGRYELAKDVSSFANAEGGFLIIGLTTDALPDAQIERVVAHDLLPEDEFDVGQYRGLIAEYVYPPIKDLKVYWTAVNPNAAAGLGVIEIPVQIQKHKYFLTAKVVEAGTQVKQIVFGLAKRTDNANDPLDVAELHRHMQQGKGTVPQTLARLEEKIDQLIATQTQPEMSANSDELYAERIARVLEENPDEE